MFEALIFLAAGLAVAGIIVALDRSRDVFHPLVLIGPMMLFLYGWMPWKLYSSGGLERYFVPDQLLFVQKLNIAGVLAFVLAALSVDVLYQGPRTGAVPRLPSVSGLRLLIGGGIAGSLGLTCWLISIVNVGGFVKAFSSSYSGGWDDSGYIRDGSLLMLVGVLLSVTALSLGARKMYCLPLIGLFGFPWFSQALLTARRGPTFAFVIVVMMGWYVSRRKRPPIAAVGIAGFCLGWIVLFLVTNRSNIYLGSSFEVKSDVSSIVDTADTGNEYIYGTGSILAAVRRDHYFWMRRYLAQVLVRPIPSAVWPDKYVDFGVPELLHNGGTGEGFADALGWDGAPGSAPGIVADLWVEMSWLSIAGMAALGWCYAYTWKKAVTLGGPWVSQYVILSALSIYLVMQTMEAVIFRTLLLSLPCWLTWRWALRAPATAQVLRRRRARASFGLEGVERA